MERRGFGRAVVCAALLGTAGCAGSDDDATTSPERSPEGASATAATTGQDSTGESDATERDRETGRGPDGSDPTGTPTPVGEPPTARIDAEPTRGPAPLTVAFDGRGSTDPDGEIVEYVWLFKDMRPPESGPTADHTFTSEGTTRRVELIVTDDDGNTDRATVEIRIEAG